MSDRNRVTQRTLDREAELSNLESKVARALDLAKRSGATGAEASANFHQGLSVSVRLGEVETLEHMQDRSIAVTVFLGRRKGSASSADLSDESIDSAVNHALDIARYTQEDPANGLADKERLATDFPELDLWHPAALDATGAIERALACEAAGRAEQGISNSEGGSFNAGLGLGVYGNSHGFLGRSSGTRFSQSCILLAGEGSGMQRDYSYDSRRSLGDLEPPEHTGREAARRTVRRLGAKPVATSEMPVLLSPDVARGLIGHLVGALSGAALYRNASFLKDRAGDALFPPWVRIVERPLMIRGQGSAAFDSEGVATQDRALVSDGVLNGYVLSSYSARRLGLETTANAGGVRNLTLEPGGAASGGLMETMAEGLYVTEVMGQGVSLVTGDYSRGASGFLIEGGKLGRAVAEVTIAGNLADMFGSLAAAGDDLDTRGNIQSGSVLISRMMVAGT